MSGRRIALLVIAGLLVLLIANFASSVFKSVPAGHVGVATLFGKVKDEPYREGLHFPVNPFYEWYLYDVRQKSHLETAQVPSQDQLQTTVDVSVQYRLEGDEAAGILRDTGDASDVVEVHIVPKLRSLIREQGKRIERAEDFFREETQERMQNQLLSDLQSYLDDKGVEVEAVLIRQIALPAFITQAIEKKKEREQEVEKQKAELERFRTEQQQKIAQAEAEREAAEQEAERRRVLADAQAYEIETVTAAIGNNPSWITLQALESLRQMAKDPAAKLYFLDSDATKPLPLMHLGDEIGTQAPRLTRE